MLLKITLAVLFAVGLGYPQQSPTLDPDSPRFEVASVKPTPPGTIGGGARPEAGGRRFRGTNVPLKSYIAVAYRMKPDQIINAPKSKWVDNDPFDIVAQAEKPSSLPEVYVMLKHLLADRFRLQFHWDTRTMPFYALTVDSGGAKLTRHDALDGGDPWIEQGWEMPLHAKWRATCASMNVLAFRLGLVMDRPVIEQTGLAGEYDFTLSYTDTPSLGLEDKIKGRPIDTSGPTLFQAVRQQLGLRLDSHTGPVSVLVIDQVDRPSEN
jgi:uncharacterized protein (TIGR03435 family)